MAKGNHQATGKKSKRGPELVQRIRSAVLNALDAVEKDGKLISEILADEFKSNPLKFMDMVSKYCPKEVAMELEANVVHMVEELSDDELANIASAGRKRTAKKANGKTKPASVH